VWTVG